MLQLHLSEAQIGVVNGGKKAFIFSCAKHRIALSVGDATAFNYT